MAWNYPELLAWIEVWFASAAGGWNEPLVDLAWCGALAAFVAHWVHSVVNLWYSWAGAIVGAMLVPTLVAYRSPKTREAGGWAAAAMLRLSGRSPT